MGNVPEELIVRHLQKTSSDEEEARLHEWLREDEQHVALFCEMREIMHSRNNITDKELSLGWDELSRRISRQMVFRKRIIPVWLRYVAATVAGIIVASSVWFAFRPHTVEEKVWVQNVIYNNNGIQKITLPDNSVVWLNENSKLTYNDHFSGEQRDVTLEGNAFFEVEKDVSKPFIVNTGNISIQVIGTTFFIRSCEEKHTIVTLVSGGINVNHTDADGNRLTLARLMPGQEADYNPVTAECYVKFVDTDYYTVWKDGSYRFNNETFATIARQMEHHFGIKIQLSPQLESMRFTGRIMPEHTIENVMEIIHRSRPIKYRITPSIVYIEE
ncbi:MAG: FecR family protein [Tannerellaceae bacterium]|jgi:ferric-dicitrate binding protein FerR (iron transport regulator)|nr:FecR family protein [Tannerellaceae bacterium]